MVGIILGNQAHGSPDHFVGIARDDGRFIQPEGFRNQADRHVPGSAALPERPVSHIGEDHLHDGLVGLDGEFAVRIRDGGEMAFRNGHMDRLQWASGHPIQYLSGHDISQPDGIRLGGQRKRK